MKTSFVPVLFSCLFLLSACGNSKPAKPAETADEAVMQFVDGVKNNEVALTAWDMLPKSYQNQYEDAKNEFVKDMDADLWETGTALVPKLHTVLKDQKELILASPMARKLPMQDSIDANYDAMLDMLKALSKSDLMTLESMKNTSIRDVLRTTGSSLNASYAKMDLSGTDFDVDKEIFPMEDLKNMEAELVSEDGDSAVVDITFGDETEEVEFVRVEGKWIPEDLADNFDYMMETLNDDLEDIKFTPEMKARAKMGLNMVDGIIDQVAEAETQEDLQGALMSFIMMMSM